MAGSFSQIEAPSGIQMRDIPDGFEVSTHFRHGLFTTYAILLAVMSSTSGVGTGVLAIDAARHHPSKGWTMSILFGAFSLLMVWIGLRYAMGALVHCCGRWVFRVSGDTAMFAVRMPWQRGMDWPCQFAWSQVAGFSVDPMVWNAAHERIRIHLDRWHADGVLGQYPWRETGLFGVVFPGTSEADLPDARG